jgi:hypothetical protein
MKRLNGIIGLIIVGKKTEVLIWDDWIKSLKDFYQLVRLCQLVATSIRVWWDWIARLALELVSLAAMVMFGVINRTAWQHLHENDTASPNVNGLTIAFVSEDDLRSPVPPWHYAASKVSGRFLLNLLFVFIKQRGHILLKFGISRFSFLLVRLSKILLKWLNLDILHLWFPFW